LLVPENTVVVKKKITLPFKKEKFNSELWPRGIAGFCSELS